MILMSNNQWKCDDNNDHWRAIGEDCSSDARSAGLIRAYKEILPDVIGLQEVSEYMAELVMAEMRAFSTDQGTSVSYRYITGGDTPVMYRADKLLLTESGHLCYSEAIPGMDGSFNNSRTKSYAYGVFEVKESGKIFAFMSTHLWWMSSDPSSKNYRPHSDEARAYQIGIAAAKMNEVAMRYGCPAIIAGDFNATADSPCLKAARADRWTDVYDLALNDRDETSGHHYCYADGFRHGDMGSYQNAIDHIMVKGDGITISSFCRFKPEWFDKLSDHYPLYTVCEID